MQYEIEELGVGGILDRAVTLVKNHFGLLFGITLVLLVPYTLLQNFLILGAMPAMPANPTAEDAAAFGAAVESRTLSVMVLSLLAAFVVVPITNAAVIQAVAKKYLNETISVGDAIKGSFGIVVPLLVTWLLQGLAIMGGFILLIIPGFLCAFWFCLSSHVVVIERVSGVAALKRSKGLMKGSFGTVFVLMFLIGIIQYAITLCVLFIPQPQLRIIGQAVLQAIATIFAASAMVVLYFSCRCKTDNFDLTRLAEAVNQESSGVAAGDNPYSQQ